MGNDGRPTPKLSAYLHDVGRAIAPAVAGMNGLAVASEKFHITENGTVRLIRTPGYFKGLVCFNNASGTCDTDVALWDDDPAVSGTEIIPVTVPSGDRYYAPFGDTEHLFRSLWAVVSGEDGNTPDVRIHIGVNY